MRRETSLGILENMMAREQRYNSQEALVMWSHFALKNTAEWIWNDYGDEEDFDSDQNEVESYELASKGESGESEGASGTEVYMRTGSGA